ncbi:MAG: SMP-30/gluconolactonase/LRE family protein [Rhizomicrobium sp.]
MNIREFATGLRFPEGPVAMDDGSVIVVEIAAGRITRIKPDGKKKVVAETGGGPNGLAIGPDGALYVCNNGDNFTYTRRSGLTVPGHAPKHHRGGRIERVNLSTGKVEVVYDRFEGQRLMAPNDIVFDKAGGFWFTDHGTTTDKFRTHGALYYAMANGSRIRRIRHELITPNGVGLSPDGKTVYYAETFTGRLWALHLHKPGNPEPVTGFTPGTFVGAYPGIAYFDSLGVQADGQVCVATILAGGITTFDPVNGKTSHWAYGDPLVTNICWGGKDMKTAYITASGTGKLLAVDWPKPGLRLNYNA